MLEVLTDEEGDSPDEGSEAAGDDGILRSESSRSQQITSRGGTRYYNKEQQLELVLATQGLVYEDAHQASGSRSEGADADDLNQTDIWEDAMCMEWLKEGFLPDEVNSQERRRVRKRAKQYCWKDGKLYFKGLYVPKPEERLELVTQMHGDLGHFGEQRTLTKICQR
jgi:hypothetical protein